MSEQTALLGCCWLSQADGEELALQAGDGGCWMLASCCPVAFPPALLGKHVRSPSQQVVYMAPGVETGWLAAGAAGCLAWELRGHEVLPPSRSGSGVTGSWRNPSRKQPER